MKMKNNTSSIVIFVFRRDNVMSSVLIKHGHCKDTDSMRGEWRRRGEEERGGGR